MKNKSKRSITRRLRLLISTVYRVLERFCQYGDVRPGKIGRPDISTILSKAQLLVLMEDVTFKALGTRLTNDTTLLKNQSTIKYLP